MALQQALDRYERKKNLAMVAQVRPRLEALRAGTGVPASQLYAGYFRSFGAADPKPVPPATIGPSIVHTGASAGGAQGTARPNGAPAQPAGGAGDLPLIGVAALVGVIALAGIGAYLVQRRRRAT